jgi:hypothetical protein
MLDATYAATRAGLAPDADDWRVINTLMQHLESVWTEPDEGIWEVRGPRRHFTHSKVMAWVAADRMVKMSEAAGREAPTDRWRALRAAIHEDVCRRGFDPGRNAFVQSYGARELDASLLMIPLVGFLPAEDPRVRGTVAAIERGRRALPRLLVLAGGQSRAARPPRRGAPALRPAARAAQRRGAARRAVRSPRPPPARQLPQALSHIALVNSACNLSQAGRPARLRADGG